MADLKRCPDCDVTLEEVKFGMSDAWNPHVKTDEARDGILGSLGAKESKDVTARMCPECGRLLLHAELDG